MSGVEWWVLIIGYAMGAIGMGMIFDMLTDRSTLLGVIAGLLWPLAICVALPVMVWDALTWCVIYVWLWVRER